MVPATTLLLLGLLQLASSFRLEEYLDRNAVTHLTSYQIEQRANFVEDKITELVEKLKSEMKEGVPDMGIPPLDPLRLGDYNLGPLELGGAGTIDVANFSHITCLPIPYNFQIYTSDTYTVLTLEVSNVTTLKEVVKVYGLPEFEMTGMKMNIFSLTLLLNLTFDHVRVDGRYAIDGNLLGIVPVYGGGPFHVEVSDLLIAGTAKISVQNGKINIKKLGLFTTVGHVHIHFEELMGGGDFGDQLNGIMQSAGQVLLNKFGPTIGDLLSEFARHKLNDALQHVDFGNIVG